MTGAFVISLDFELHWGVRDNSPATGSYCANILGARDAIPEMLAMFDAYDIAATWATVGFLFAETKEERLRFAPDIRPAYVNTALDAYAEATGNSEDDDPLHYAGSLIKLIGETKCQEIATHTLSHYNCLAQGQNADAFSADLNSARAIAARRGYEITSIVFPRNQFNRQYAPILLRSGITAYRGNEPSWMYAATPRSSVSQRVGRFIDTYHPVAPEALLGWDELIDEFGLCNIASSRFLRSWSRRLAALEPLRLRRITTAMHAAATSGKIFHLWWHPHNFGVNRRENLDVLRRILDYYSGLRQRYYMKSLSMVQVVAIATKSDGVGV